jgi:hypothetical protein
VQWIFAHEHVGRRYGRRAPVIAAPSAQDPENQRLDQRGNQDQRYGNLDQRDAGPDERSASPAPTDTARLCAGVTPAEVQERLRFLAFAARTGRTDAQVDFYLEEVWPPLRIIQC